MPQPSDTYRDWQVPNAMSSEDRILGWVNETCEEGISWTKSQRGYPDWRRALDIISGRADLVEKLDYRSKVSTNRLKRNIREITGTLAKLRPMWGYYSDNRAYQPKADAFNKLGRFWYLEQMADRTIHDALDYAAATGRGWVRPVYRRDFFGTGRGDIRLFAYGAPCVLPFQLPASNDWQSAYAVTIMDEMPVAMAHGMFPLYQDRLRPSSSRYWYSSDQIRQAATGNWMSRAFGKVKRAFDSQLSDLYVPIRYTYVIDLAMNVTGGKDGKTGQEIPMGEMGATWAYKVPYIGQRIPTGTDPATGQPTFRDANENDARLYPHRRLIISTDQVKLYDGPAFDWHGMFPAVSFCLDSWPWEPLGFSLVHDGSEIQNAINTLVRGNINKANAQLNRAMAYDINAVDQKSAERFDPLQPNVRIGYDGTATENPPFVPAIPAEELHIDPESGALVEYLESTMDHQQAVNEAMALAKARTAGSMDELEKLMQVNGPIVENMSRDMEPPMRDLGSMLKYDFMQYYPVARMFQILGPDGVPMDTFDYDPSSIVPSHAPGENVEQPSVHNAAQRARILADNMRFFILPNTLHEIHQVTFKLGLIQLKKAGVIIDSQTIAEAWSVPNYGNIDGSTVLERAQRETEMQLENMARAQAIGQELGLGPPPGAADPKSGKGNPEGRPPSGAAAPALKSKDNGARSTITESK